MDDVVPLIIIILESRAADPGSGATSRAREALITGDALVSFGSPAQEPMIPADGASRGNATGSLVSSVCFERSPLGRRCLL
ncbi:Hypothetical protein NTJ_05343 [Nesidiocoris tenuis]|uniref:Uncharacterized protein n=1 Tax=Nesidiocoris tenuis TaxID=355587 RepID=A0ABN7AMR8_9HEMI|nr:Hypothetical protein NTJ_05343 [Nesidiocoris tenuis]